jgi:hypothetical protein
MYFFPTGMNTINGMVIYFVLMIGVNLVLNRPNAGRRMDKEASLSKAKNFAGGQIKNDKGCKIVGFILQYIVTGITL